MLGRAATVIWCDVLPAMKAEWEDWHSHEHQPERLGIPGFLRGTRWIALSGEPSYFMMYEAETIATMTTGPYMERLNNPTPWSVRMMPEHRNMVRSVCHVRASFGAGVPQVLATLRLDKALGADALSELPRRRGLTVAHLLESERMSALPQTAEQRIRGGDAQAHWVALIGGYDAEAVRAAAGAAAPGATQAVYRLSNCLTARDLQ